MRSFKRLFEVLKRARTQVQDWDTKLMSDMDEMIGEVEVYAQAERTFEATDCWPKRNREYQLELELVDKNYTALNPIVPIPMPYPSWLTHPLVCCACTLKGCPPSCKGECGCQT